MQKKSGTTCKAHNSKKNLDIMIKKFRSILSQSTEISTDWEKKKELDLGSNCYLTMASNFQVISGQILEISRLVKCLNISRKNLWKFRHAIKNFNVRKPDLTKQEGQVTPSFP